MIIHIALFKWKKGVSKKNILNALKIIKNLKTKCRGITNIYCGKNYHKMSKGFMDGVVIIAKDQKSLDGYRYHKDHKKIAEYIDTIVDDGLGFDFEDII